MSDIVKKLRDLEQWIREPERESFTLPFDLFDEAANEMERLYAEEGRLRKALAKIAQYDMQAIAIDALQPGERIRPPAPGVSND
jgi:hypothetical protein